MARGAIIVLMALALAACKPAPRDQGSGAIPPADAPANPAEPASGPPAAGPVQPADPLMGSLDARGTEPFWAVQIRPGGIVVKRPDATDMIAANPGPTRTADGAIWATEITATGAALRITLAPGDCSDGMSDNGYPFTATVVLEGAEPLRGCAEPAKPRP